MFYEDAYDDDDAAAFAAFDELAEDFDARDERAMLDREDEMLGVLDALEQRLADMEAEQHTRAFTGQVHALHGLVDQRFDAIAERAGVNLSPQDRAHILAVAQSLTPRGEAPDLDAAFDALRNIGTPARTAPADQPPRSVDSIDFNNDAERVQLIAERVERARADEAKQEKPAPVTAENTDFTDREQRVAYFASRMEQARSDAQPDTTPDAAA
jgi:hypothetical protein